MNNETAQVKTVREFSAAGPCIVRGVLVRETASFLVYSSPRGERRIKKSIAPSTLVHTDACVSCRDHARSQYPNGYED